MLTDIQEALVGFMPSKTDVFDTPVLDSCYTEHVFMILCKKKITWEEKLCIPH